MKVNDIEISLCYDHDTTMHVLTEQPVHHCVSTQWCTAHCTRTTHCLKNTTFVWPTTKAPYN